MDNRKNKTKTAIKQAFTELLQEKSFEKITVTEITKRANIGRKTFYLHYSCIDDIIRGIEEDYTTICLNKLKKYIGNEKHDIHDIFNDVNQIISSSAIKELVAFGVSIEKYVPKCLVEEITMKFNRVEERK